MRGLSLSTLTITGLIVATLAPGAAMAQHDHEIVAVGRDAGGKLRMHTHAVMPFDVPESPFQGIAGYATAEVALESLLSDHTNIGLFTLDPSSDIRARLVGADAGIQVYDGLNPLAIGDEINLGHPIFHYLPVWNIFDGVIGQAYGLNFVFRDASGLYSDSDPIQLTFTPVPSPGSIGLGLIGLNAIAARRRR
ncbi:MAG: hypothetical protein JNM07_08930 [Phycisphaerae bacterium]|nr:hypothetical protein [Phycisphaerae bacterium]